jgi:putative mycofactocin binding protein MftB
MRVRKESFGLLFYSVRAARLTFVGSRELLLLTVDPAGGLILRGQVRSGGDETRARRLLDAMQKKGLVVERPCAGVP